MAIFKFMFIFISGNADYQKDFSQIISQGGNITKTVAAASIDDACEAAKLALEDNYNLIELCGAFGPNGAKRVIEATENKIAVGYVTHLPEQEELYTKLFG
ncbi:MAG: DUF6506 family protein [Clostridia bacterium]